MRQIAIINQKGGVGKTTTTANLGAALASSGSRVLLIDLDPQAHLTLHWGTDIRDGVPTIYDVLTSKTPISSVIVPVCDNVFLVPADIDLAAAESELISVTGREVILREALGSITDQYDHLLIDCPPSLGVLTINALVAGREVIIPLQTQFFALQGLSRLFDTVMLVKQRINPVLTVTGVVLCMHENQTRLSNEIVDDLTGFLENARRSEVPWANAVVFKTCIRRNIKLAEASSFGQSIFQYAPRSNGALDYADLADEIFGAPVELVGREGPIGVCDEGYISDGRTEIGTTTDSRPSSIHSSLTSVARPSNGRYSVRPPTAQPHPGPGDDSTSSTGSWTEMANGENDGRPSHGATAGDPSPAASNPLSRDPGSRDGPHDDGAC